MGRPTGHEISYPDELNAEDLIKTKADMIFVANKIIEPYPNQFDISVKVIKQPDRWIFIHDITCSICGSVVGGALSYAQRHIELHIKHGD